ncbi:Ig-like domain-containing protein [Glaciihabitans sp. dw_435]|uniref:beta strand repeat-containing protein n=1 Tax=Glaciihabitans sp. dw_435 TaxID=2720081 RepID=UPI001BD29C59|nr:Ig-like domain-containing protein [Glaciihabitans sp. dw_435]
MDHSPTPAASIAARDAPRSFRRVVATVVTAALAIGGLSLAGVAPASAAPSAATTGTVTRSTFTWNVSEQVHSALPNATVTDGVTVDDTTHAFTWSNGTGSVNTTTGASDISYTGSARVAFTSGSTEYYSIVLANPEVTVDAAGNGAIIADVSYAVIALGPNNPAVSGTTADVVVTRFTTGNGTGDVWTTADGTSTLTDTPVWANVIAPNSADATFAGLAADLPLDGKSFAKEYLAALPSTLRPHFYASGTAATPTASNPKKAPSAFTQTAKLVTPTVDATVSTDSYATGVSIPVTGNGFRAVTNTGDAGVYVALAPVGMTNFSSPAGFLGAQWLNAAALSTGAFSKTLLVPASKLDPTKSYAVYTWQAHTHSNTSQDTQTPVTIDFAALASATTLTVARTTMTTANSTTLTAGVTSGATGTVEFFDGSTSLGSAPVSGTTATLTVSKLTAGTHSITAVYSGNTALVPSTSTAASITVTSAPAVRVNSYTGSLSGGLKINVSGSGFRGVTNSGDAGIYIGVTQAGGFTDHSSANMGSFLGTQWINAALLNSQNGSFTIDLASIPAAKLDPTKSYSIYTWQAHTYSNDSQDTEMPITIDYGTLTHDASTVSVSLSASTVANGSAVNAFAAVPAGATGTVDFYEGSTLLGSAPIGDGVAKKSLTVSGVGSHAITATYAGDARFTGSTSAATVLTIGPAPTVVTLTTSTAKAISGKAFSATVVATNRATTGSVRFSLNGKAIATRPLVSGKASIIFGSMPVSTNKLTVTYLGNADYAPATSKTVAFIVQKATTAKVVVGGGSFAKKTTPVVAVKVWPLSNGQYATGKINLYVGNKLVKTVTMTAANKGTIKTTLPKQTKSITVHALYVGTATAAGKTSAAITLKAK